MELVIYTDGSCENNPGRCGCAFVVYKDGVKIYEKKIFLGHGTNNIGEWMAVYEALKWLSENNEYSCVIKSDSKLVINQITGLWKIKNEKLKTINKLCLKYKISNLNIRYEWVKAHSTNSKNNYVDKLAKESLI